MSGREASGATFAAAEAATPAEAANDDVPAVVEAASNVVDLSNPQDDAGGESGGGGGVGDADAAPVVHSAPTWQVYNKPLRASPPLCQHLQELIRREMTCNVAGLSQPETQSTS
eukprot:CAMPEP_0185810284 /NCGR_PEP_ID=MMETSP1322-20130828/6698_1 /TAXON_ID=265543 /ORGANISM="Minutocellus polymorphus, Strain RCC2270" /LENGTH=113 /DNA_ID=CAMNT_0028506593 /DNA_START=115 /DNA_END=456 /DNA_ORIENTATION=+